MAGGFIVDFGILFEEMLNKRVDWDGTAPNQIESPVLRNDRP